MSIHDKHKEHRFETEIVEYLTSNVINFYGYSAEDFIFLEDLHRYY